VKVSIGPAAFLPRLGQFLIAVPRLATLAEPGCEQIGLRRTPAEGNHCDDLLALAAEKAFPVLSVPRNGVAHFWRHLPRVVAFAHNPKFNRQHGTYPMSLPQHSFLLVALLPLPPSQHSFRAMPATAVCLVPLELTDKTTSSDFVDALVSGSQKVWASFLKRFAIQWDTFVPNLRASY